MDEENIRNELAETLANDPRNFDKIINLTIAFRNAGQIVPNFFSGVNADLPAGIVIKSLSRESGK